MTFNNANTNTKKTLKKVKKNWVVMGTLLAITGATMMVGGQAVKADEQQSSTQSQWVANTSESIASRISDGAKEITVQKGDTVWEIGQAINMKNPMELLPLNGMEDGDQYTLEIGTVIRWDGNIVTVTDTNGNTKETVVSADDKVDALKTVANQESDTPTSSNHTEDALAKSAKIAGFSGIGSAGSSHDVNVNNETVTVNEIAPSTIVEPSIKTDAPNTINRVNGNIDLTNESKQDAVYDKITESLDNAVKSEQLTRNQADSLIDDAYDAIYDNKSDKSSDITKDVNKVIDQANSVIKQNTEYENKVEYDNAKAEYDNAKAKELADAKEKASDEIAKINQLTDSIKDDIKSAKSIDELNDIIVRAIELAEKASAQKAEQADATKSVTSEQVKDEEIKSETVTSEQATSEEIKSETATSEQATSEEVKSETATSEQATSEETKSETVTSEEVKSETATSEQAKSEETKSETATSEQATSEEIKSETVTSEQATSETPNSQSATSTASETATDTSTKAPTIDEQPTVQDVVETSVVERTDYVAYAKDVVYDDTLDYGTEIVTQAGQQGYNVVSVTTVTTNGVVTSQTETTTQSVAPVNEIVRVGTKKVVEVPVTDNTNTGTTTDGNSTSTDNGSASNGGTKTTVVNEKPAVDTTTPTNGSTETPISKDVVETSSKDEIRNVVSYETVYEDDPTLEVGKEIESQAGQDGYDVVTVTTTTTNGVVTSTSETVKSQTPMVQRIVKRGTKVVASATSEQAKSEEVKSETATSEQAKSEEVKSETATSEQAKSEETKSETATSEQATSEETKSETVTSEEVKSETATSEQAKSEETKSETATSEQATSEEVKSETQEPVYVPKTTTLDKVTRNVLTDGTELGGTVDTNKYDWVSSVYEEVKTTAENGDITITPTITITYKVHEPKTTTNKTKTVNVLEDGTTLSGDVDTSKYELVSSVKTEDKQTAENGDVTITPIVTNTYKEKYVPKTITNDKVTINVLADGTDLGETVDTDKYELVSSTYEDVKTFAENGDTIVTPTVTNTYKVYEPKTTTNATKVVNVLEDGTTLGETVDTDKYELVSTVNSEEKTTAKNGDATVTPVVTNTYKEKYVPKTITNAKVTRNVLTDGTELSGTVDTNKYTWVSSEYDEIKTTAENGDTIVTPTITNTYKVYEPKTTTNATKVVNVLEDGTKLDSTVDSSKYELVSSVKSEEKVTASNGDVTITPVVTNTYKEKYVPKTTTASTKTVNVLEDGTKLTGTVDSSKYELVSSVKSEEKVTASNGDVTITPVVTNTYEVKETMSVDSAKSSALTTIQSARIPDSQIAKYVTALESAKTQKEIDAVLANVKNTVTQYASKTDVQIAYSDGLTIISKDTTLTSAQKSVRNRLLSKVSQKGTAADIYDYLAMWGYTSSINTYKAGDVSQYGFTNKESKVESEFTVLLNQYRAENGANPVTVVSSDSALQQAANQRAKEIAMYGTSDDADKYFEHVRTNGDDWFTVLDDYGVERYSAGEIILYLGTSTDASTLAKTFAEKWEASSGHAKIMRGVYYDKYAFAIYEREDGRVYAVALFLNDTL